MRRQIVTVTFVIEQPEDDTNPNDPKSYFASILKGMIEAFSRKKVVEAKVVKLAEVLNVNNGTIDRSWDALPAGYTGPLFIVKED